MREWQLVPSADQPAPMVRRVRGGSDSCLSREAAVVAIVPALADLSATAQRAGRSLIGLAGPPLRWTLAGREGIS